MPGGIDHVDLVVGSLERSLPFYRELLRPLGFAEESEIAGERGERVVYLNHDTGCGIGLREAQAPGTPDRYAIGLHHLCVRAGSRRLVDDRARWAREHGASIESEPREYAYSPGYYAAFLHDPDGIKVEIRA